MADDTTDTRPGSAPGVVKTGADGSLPDLGGRPAWVWMQDTEEGGGRFDVRANRVDLWLRKGVTVVPNYPIHFGPSGRTAKPAARLSGAPSGQPAGEQPDTQTTPAPTEGADQSAGEPAAADTTTRKGGRTR